MSRVTVSALFHDPVAVEDAIYRLELAGVPRDRIEVIVSPAGARRWFHGRARSGRRQALTGAGVGAVVGLLVGGAIGLAVVALPGRNPPSIVLWAQLLGPNAGSLAGALIGAAVGWFVPERPRPVWRRVVGQEEILVAVEGCAPTEVPAAQAALVAAGGAEPAVEA
ncbi:MAG: hypothetical protein Q8P41_11865 [Pseudomonadota bacterium]|nr:hypothetical protein [Pseudomonadota bacterium]